MSTANSIPITSVDALRHAYVEGTRCFTGISLKAANLAHVDLKGADLSYTDFSHANLNQANLRGADLSYANFHNANLSGADLRGAMLIGTDLRSANLQSANLEHADYDPEATHFPDGFDPVSAGLCADR